MAVTLDQASLGTQAQSGVTSSSRTTTANVAAGGMIVALVGNFNASAETLSMSGGSLTWVEAHTTTSGSLRLSLFYALAPSGLASGTSITVTSTTALNNDMTWCMASYLGVDTTGTVVAFNASSAGTAAWASGSVAGGSGDALIGGAWGDGTLRTSTTDAPGNERIDFNSATTSGSVTLADKLSVAGTDTLDGDWSGTLTHLGIGVAFKAAAGGGGSQNISPGHVASTAQLFAPGLAPGSVTVQPGHVSSGAQLFAPGLANVLTPGTILSTAQVFAPALAPGSVTIQPGHVASTAQVFAPSTDGSIVVTPGFVASTAEVFAPTLAAGSVTVTPAHLASTAQLFAPALLGGEESEAGTARRVPSIPTIPTMNR